MTTREMSIFAEFCDGQGYREAVPCVTDDVPRLVAEYTKQGFTLTGIYLRHVERPTKEYKLTVYDPAGKPNGEDYGTFLLPIDDEESVIHGWWREVAICHASENDTHVILVMRHSPRYYGDSPRWYMWAKFEEVTK